MITCYKWSISYIVIYKLGHMWKHRLILLVLWSLRQRYKCKARQRYTSQTCSPNRQTDSSVYIHTPTSIDKLENRAIKITRSLVYYEGTASP